MTEPPSERALEALASAYIPAAVITAAIELDLIGALREPRSIDELAARLGAPTDAIARLVRALVCLGVCTRLDGRRYWTPPEMVTLLAHDGRLAPIFLHHARQLAPLLGRLAEAVCSGEPQHRAWPFASDPVAPTSYQELTRHPEQYRIFLAAMDRSSRGVGQALARHVELAAIDRVLDLGGGGGQVARELLAAAPILIVESFDLPAAAEVARERSAAAGVGDRHYVRSADIRQPIDAAPAPLVILSAVLADFGPDERRLILTHAKDLLAPDGILAVSETLLDEDRSGPPLAAMLSLVMLTAFAGDQLTESQLRADLAAVGLECAAVHRAAGPRDLVLARRAW